MFAMHIITLFFPFFLNFQKQRGRKVEDDSGQEGGGAEIGQVDGKQ